MYSSIQFLLLVLSRLAVPAALSTSSSSSSASSSPWAPPPPPSTTWSPLIVPKFSPQDNPAAFHPRTLVRQASFIGISDLRGRTLPSSDLILQFRSEPSVILNGGCVNLLWHGFYAKWETPRRVSAKLAIKMRSERRIQGWGKLKCKC